MAKFGTGDLKEPHNLIIEVSDKQVRHAYDKETNTVLPDIAGYYISAQLDQSLMKPEKVASGKTPIVTSKTQLGDKSAKNYAQTNPYLNSYSKTLPADKSNDGKAHNYTAHLAYYSAKQVKAMREAAENVKEGQKARILRTTSGRTYMGINAKVWIKEIERPVKGEDGKPIVKRDKAGKVIYKTDKNGHYLADKNGKLIPDVETRTIKYPVIDTRSMKPSTNFKFGLAALKNQAAVTKSAIAVEQAQYQAEQEKSADKADTKTVEKANEKSVDKTAQDAKTEPAKDAKQESDAYNLSDAEKDVVQSTVEKPAITKEEAATPHPATNTLQAQAENQPKGDLQKMAEEQAAKGDLQKQAEQEDPQAEDTTPDVSAGDGDALNF